MSETEERMTTDFCESRRIAIAIALDLINGRLCHRGQLVRPPIWEGFDFFWKIRSTRAKITATNYIAGDHRAYAAKDFGFYFPKTLVLSLTLAGTYKGNSAKGLAIGQSVGAREEPVGWTLEKLKYTPEAKRLTSAGSYAYSSVDIELVFFQV
jgi:hypothetical protein